MSDDNVPTIVPPTTSSGGKYARSALNAIGGAVPFVGGVFSAAAGFWSETEQERLNNFLRHWVEMLKAEMAEKGRTIVEIAQRIDLHDEEIASRVASEEFQSLLRKGFRDWAGAESEEKRILLRNILSNAAATKIVSDDIVRLFMEWIKKYSEFHFSVVSKIYGRSGATRGDVWEALGREQVREDSAEADLFKLLFRDLTMGGIIRIHRETDYQGNFIPKTPSRHRSPQEGPRRMKSAFDDTEAYDLTQLGQQFVHYAMTDLPPKLAYAPSPEREQEET